MHGKKSKPQFNTDKFINKKPEGVSDTVSLGLLHDMSSCSDCNKSATNSWLQLTHRHGHQIMNDKITAAVRTAGKPFEKMT